MQHLGQDLSDIPVQANGAILEHGGTRGLACFIALFSVLPIITRPFFLFNPMSVQWHRKGIEIILLGSLFLLSAFIMGIALIRQRKQQLE